MADGTLEIRLKKIEENLETLLKQTKSNDQSNLSLSSGELPREGKAPDSWSPAESPFNSSTTVPTYNSLKNNNLIEEVGKINQNLTELTRAVQALVSINEKMLEKSTKHHSSKNKRKNK